MPLSVDKYVLGSTDAPPAGGPALSSISSSPGRRSPPCSPPPPRPALPPGLPSGSPSTDVDLYCLPLLPVHGIDVGIDAFQDTSDEYESGELDSSESSDSWQQDHAWFVDAWVSPGRDELTDHLLFAFIEPFVPAAEVSAFIRSALRSVAPLLPVDLLPSSRGAMILRCGSLAERDSLHLLSPIACEGSELFLQRPEETTNRFYRVPTWLAFVAIVDFPNEHWYESKINDCFRGFCEVAEIDPACLTGDNFADLRLLLEVNDRLEISFQIKISSKKGGGRVGSVARVLPIRVWPRAYQLDSQGNLTRFFGPPPPLPHGPSLGPMGPFRREQQVRPQPHHLNLLYPALPVQNNNGQNQNHHAQNNISFPSLNQPANPLPTAQILGLTLAFARALTVQPSTSTSSVSSYTTTSTLPDSFPSPNPTIAPPNPLASPPSLASATPSPPIITYRRRLRPPPATPATSNPPPSQPTRPSLPAASRRHSSRLAAKAPAEFIDMTTQAVRCKSLLNSLSGCSASLKNMLPRRTSSPETCCPWGPVICASSCPWLALAARTPMLSAW